MTVQELNLPDYLQTLYMCRQVEQGNKPNLDVPRTSISSNGGITWVNTVEEGSFWFNILNDDGVLCSDFPKFEDLPEQSQKDILAFQGTFVQLYPIY